MKTEEANGAVDVVVVAEDFVGEEVRFFLVLRDGPGVVEVWVASVKGFLRAAMNQDGVEG